MTTLRISAAALALVALAACGQSSTEPTSALAPSSISARRGQAEPGDDRGNHAEPGDDKGGHGEAQPGDDKGGNKGGKRNDDPANHH
jgi:hypothetical protein